MKKYLAIDYGTKRIGVAISRMWLAEPLTILPTDSAVHRLVAIINDERPDALVIGIADGPMAEAAKVFAMEVSKATNGLPIVEVDETLSSVETHAKVAKSGMSRSRRQQDIDHYAAATFLQDFLDTQKEE